MENNIIYEKLHNLNWNVVDNEKLLSVNDFRMRVDCIIEINNELFAAELKKSKNIQNIISTTFYRVYTHLNTLCKNTNYHPLAIFIVDNINNSSSINTLNKQFEKYAAEFSWLIVSRAGGYIYKLYNENDISYFDLNVIDKRIDKSSNGHLGFSDLELWMFKIIYFYNHKNKSNIAIFNNEYIENAYQLSKISNVSQRTANNWVNKMTDLGYIKKDVKGSLLIINLEKFLNLWSGRYNIKDNNSLKYFNYIQSIPNAKEKIIDRIENLSIENTNYLITGHFAARLYNISISNADTLHIYSFTNDIKKIEDDLGLVESNDDTGITIIEPKFKDSIKRAQSIMEKKYIVDLIQLYLDCKSLKDRGFEQSEEIKNILLNNYE